MLLSSARLKPNRRDLIELLCFFNVGNPFQDGLMVAAVFFDCRQMVRHFPPVVFRFRSDALAGFPDQMLVMISRAPSSERAIRMPTVTVAMWTKKKGRDDPVDECP